MLSNVAWHADAGPDADPGVSELASCGEGREKGGERRLAAVSAMLPVRMQKAAGVPRPFT
jgi:hypothetical protein